MGERDGFTVVGGAAHAMWDTVLLGRSLVGTLKDDSDKDRVWKSLRRDVRESGRVQ